MKNAILIFALALGAYTLTAGGHLYSPDEEVLFRSVRSLYEDGDLSIEPLPQGFATSRDKDGNEYAQYGVGQTILALPFYAVGRWAGPFFGDPTWRRLYGINHSPESPVLFPPSTHEIAPRFACSFFNIFFSALFAGLLYLLLFELTAHRGASLLAAALYAFGSLAWAHSRPFYTEIAAAFFIVFSWYALLRATRGRMTAWCLAAGAAAGFAALIRMDSILLYPGLAIFLLGPIRDFTPLKKPGLHPWIAFCTPAMVCGAIILALNTIHFGGPFASGYSDQPEGVNFSTPVLAGLYGFLFSAGKGLFFFSPGLVLSLWSCGAMIRRNKALAWAVGVSIIVPLLIMSKWQNWAGGWCWGPRHIFMIHPFLAVPIACWLARGWSSRAGRFRRRAALATITMGVAIQLFGSSVDYMRFHRLFFRDPARNFDVLFDGFDEQYWAHFYKLNALPPNEPPREVPLRYVPAPIQHSIYIPQSSVWSGYPLMWRWGMIDNVWVRLLRGAED